MPALPLPTEVLSSTWKARSLRQSPADSAGLNVDMHPLSSHLPSLGYSVVPADRQPSVLPLGLCNELRALVFVVFVCVSVSPARLWEAWGSAGQ